MLTLTASAFGENTRILFVDDDPREHDLIEGILELHPRFEVVAVHSSQAALAKLEAGEKFDLIVTDLRMKGSELDGFQMGAKIKQLYPQQRIVLRTSSLAEIKVPPFYTQKQVEEAGFTGILSKGSKASSFGEFAKSIDTFLGCLGFTAML